MPGPAATSNMDGNGTFREHKQDKYVHQAQPAAADHVKPGTRPAAVNKWTKDTAPSTQYGAPGYKPSPFRPSTLADHNPTMLAHMTSFGNSPAPIPPALAKHPKARPPGTCWVKGCMGSDHTKWQDCPKTADYFADHKGPGPMDTTVSKHSSPPTPASRKRSASAAPPPPAQRRQQLQTPNLAARGYAITAEVLRKPNPVLQSSGYSKLASADPAQCASDLLHLQDRRLLQPLVSELQSLSGKSFTLDAAANDSGDNAHSSSFCSPSNSFMNELHSGHIWVNAPFTLLLEFVQHYLQCKQAAPSTTACIVVPGFLLPVMRPFLKGMHILKTYRKGSTLFDAPTASGKRRAMAGTHWPVHVFTDAVVPTHLPPVAGQQCHPLHKAVVHHPSAVPSVAAAVSNQPLTMLFEGRLEQQDALMLLDSGASANFISKKALDIGKLTLNPTEATLELADGSSSPILGTTEVTLHIGAFRTRVPCFVTELSIDFDIVLGNPFLTGYKAVLNYHLGTCTLVQHNKTYTLRPLSYCRADLTHHTALTLLGSLQHL